jgi:ribosomal protein S18 acetylase RimI-like enzyme
MQAQLRPLLEFGLEPSLEAMNEGYSDYFVPIRLEFARFLGMAKSDGVDFSLSRAIIVDDAIAGVALIARRGWTTRLAAMSVRPAFRGKGLGRQAMNDLIAESEERGDHRMVLEVIESNTPAVRLYEASGFRVDRRLLGFKVAESAPSDEVATLEDVDIRNVAVLVGAHGIENLPWQLSAETLAHQGPPSVGFQLGHAHAVITNPQAAKIVLQCLIVDPSHRGQGHASELLHALFGRFTGREWVVPPVCPEELAPFLQRMGFELQELSQLQMSRTTA